MTNQINLKKKTQKPNWVGGLTTPRHAMLRQQFELVTMTHPATHRDPLHKTHNQAQNQPNPINFGQPATPKPITSNPTNPKSVKPKPIMADQINLKKKPKNLAGWVASPPLATRCFVSDSSLCSCCDLVCGEIDREREREREGAETYIPTSTQQYPTPINTNHNKSNRYNNKFTKNKHKSLR
jgi:hypothetical protein